MNKRLPLKWIWDVSGRIKWLILALIILYVLDSSSSVVMAWVLKSVINSAVSGSKDEFLSSAAKIAGLTLFQIAAAAAIRFLVEYTRSGAENTFKKRLFSCLMTKDYSEVTAVHSGEWMNRLTSDTAVTADGLTIIVPEAAGMIFKLSGAIVSMVFLLPSAGVLILPFGIFIVLLTYLFRKKLRSLHKRIQETDGVLRVFMSERLKSLMMIKAFSSESGSVSQAGEKMSLHRKARMKRNNFSNICNIGFGTALKGVYACGAVYCAYGIFTGALSYGTFTAVLGLIDQIKLPFAQISGYLPRYYAMTASAERLMEAEEFADDTSVSEGYLTDAADFYRSEFESLVFENVSFSYEGKSKRVDINPKVLDKFSFEIKKGEYVSFTGHSGCGKSTVFKLILSLYREYDGKIFIRTSGDDIIPDASFRKLFTYVPQGNQLMSGTIRETVAFSDPEKMKMTQKIADALRIACADDFTGSLPDGIDTVLGENGSGISEGQMQRIAIARAVFSQRPFILLDEATSSLDEQTERKVLENIKSLTDKTVIIITHRPAALEICDRNIFFGDSDENGKTGM